jgi:hypothetical protein
MHWTGGHIEGHGYTVQWSRGAIWTAYYRHVQVAVAPLEDCLAACRRHALAQSRKGLTKRQGDILDYCIRRVESGANFPTLREICAEFGIKSPNGALCHIKPLAAKGFIKQEAFGKRWQLA